MGRFQGDQAALKRELGEAHRLYAEMGATGHAERLTRELGRERRRFLWLVACVVLLMLPFLLGPDAAGLSSGERTVRRELSGVVETEHIRLHYDPEGPVAGPARVKALQAEVWVRRHASRLGIEPPVVEFFLYDGPEEMARHTGARGFAFAQPWRPAIHLHAEGTRVLSHELVHAIADALGVRRPAPRPRRCRPLRLGPRPWRGGSRRSDRRCRRDG